MSNASNVDQGSIHTYRGRTVEELLPKIQDELGAGAIILRRREGLSGGIAGFFQRRFVELDATEGGPQIDVYDEPGTGAAATFTPSRELPLHRRATPEAEPLSPLNTAYVTERLAALARAGPLEPPRLPGPRHEEPQAESTARISASVAGISEPSDPFALMLERASSHEEPGHVQTPWPGSRTASHPRTFPSGPTFADETTFPNPSTPPLQGRAPGPSGRAPSHEPASPQSRAPGPSRARAKIQEGLLALGTSEQFAEELIDGATVHIRPFAPRASLSQAVGTALTGRIPVAPPLPARGAAIVLVGPGGAGKTSCCAALLGAYRKGSALPASCATLVKGQTSGELRMLLSPYVMKPTAIDTTRAVRALRKTKSEGLLVIDTPPLSPGDRSGTRKLASLLAELEPERIVVVLPTTLSAVSAGQLLEALGPLKANALALTHADDTDQIGVAIEAACKFDLAPEYILGRARTGGWTIGRLDPAGLAAKLVQ
jgi:flagellar biosynthesis protein FlhF